MMMMMMGAAADKMQTTAQGSNAEKAVAWAYFYTDYGHWAVDANHGCRYDSDTNVPGIVELCVDWNKGPNGRAHFIFVGQNRRCLLNTKLLGETRCTSHIEDGVSSHCWQHEWTEVACTW